jgi:glycosidase
MRRSALTSTLAALLLGGPALAGPGAPTPVASPPDLRPVPRQIRPSPLPEGWQHGAFMEIFVRAYQDSDGDGIGDLNGLIQRLPYLQALGVNGLWLMPITASSDRDHGYATTDYRALEPQYGRLADFDRLLREAHRRGMGVIIDYVINHASDQHPLFQAARRDARSPYRAWFVWQDPAPSGWDIWGQNPWYATTEGRGHYFATFGPQMPDFNMREPAVLDYHLASLRFWLNRGLDGFRLDAVPHLVENNARDWNDQPESRALTQRLQREIKRYPRRHVVCEATANPQVYGRPEVCGSAFAFGLEQQILKASSGEDAAATQALADYFKTAPVGMATMLANHDIFAGRRIWDQLAGDEARYKLAAASYLLLPGTPFIYYGEEIGMAGVAGLPGDEPLRAPMSWSADGRGFSPAGGQPFRPLAPNIASHNVEAQARDPASLLNFYKAMLGLRQRLPSIARGRYEQAQVLEQGRLFSFQRRWGEEHSLVLIHYGREPLQLDLDQLPAQAALRPEYPAQALPQRSDAAGRVRLALPPQSVTVYRLLKP